MIDYTIQIANKEDLQMGDGTQCPDETIIKMIENFNAKSKKEIIVGEVTDFNPDIAFESVDVANASHRIYSLLFEDDKIYAKITTSPGREGRLLESLLQKDEVTPYIRYYYDDDKCEIEINTVNFQLN